MMRGAKYQRCDRDIRTDLRERWEDIGGRRGWYMESVLRAG